MPVHKIEPVTSGESGNAAIIWPSADATKKITISHSQLVGTRVVKEAQLIRFIQIELDIRQRVNQLPNDDPDRDADPGRDDHYWGDADGTPNPSGGNRWLISRGVVCTSAVWDDTEKIYVLGLRKSHKGPIGS